MALLRKRATFYGEATSKGCTFIHCVVALAASVHSLLGATRDKVHTLYCTQQCVVFNLAFLNKTLVDHCVGKRDSRVETKRITLG